MFPPTRAPRCGAWRSTRGVPYETVLQAWRDDDLVRVIELRDRSPLSPAKGPGFGARDGEQALSVLSFKREPGW